MAQAPWVPLCACLAVEMSAPAGASDLAAFAKAKAKAKLRKVRRTPNAEQWCAAWSRLVETRFPPHMNTPLAPRMSPAPSPLLDAPLLELPPSVFEMGAADFR